MRDWTPRTDTLLTGLLARGSVRGSVPHRECIGGENSCWNTACAWPRRWPHPPPRASGAAPGATTTPARRSPDGERVIWPHSSSGGAAGYPASGRERFWSSSLTALGFFSPSSRPLRGTRRFARQARTYLTDNALFAYSMRSMRKPLIGGLHVPVPAPRGRDPSSKPLGGAAVGAPPEADSGVWSEKLLLPKGRRFRNTG